MTSNEMVDEIMQYTKHNNFKLSVYHSDFSPNEYHVCIKENNTDLTYVSETYEGMLMQIKINYNVNIERVCDA